MLSVDAKPFVPGRKLFAPAREPFAPAREPFTVGCDSEPTHELIWIPPAKYSSTNVLTQPATEAEKIEVKKIVKRYMKIYAQLAMMNCPIERLIRNVNALESAIHDNSVDGLNTEKEEMILCSQKVELRKRKKEFFRLFATMHESPRMLDLVFRSITKLWYSL